MYMDLTWNLWPLESRQSVHESNPCDYTISDSTCCNRCPLCCCLSRLLVKTQQLSGNKSCSTSSSALMHAMSAGLASALVSHTRMWLPFNYIPLSEKQILGFQSTSSPVISDTLLGGTLLCNKSPNQVDSYTSNFKVYSKAPPTLWPPHQYTHKTDKYWLVSSLWAKLTVVLKSKSFGYPGPTQLVKGQPTLVKVGVSMLTSRLGSFFTNLLPLIDPTLEPSSGKQS